MSLSDLRLHRASVRSPPQLLPSSTHPAQFILTSIASFTSTNYSICSPQTSPPHRTTLLPPLKNNLPNPQFLAPSPRTGTARHRPIHPTIRLRPPPLLLTKPLRLAFRNRFRGWQQRRPQIRIHSLRVCRKRVFRGHSAGEEILASEE